MIKELVVGLYLLAISEATPIKSHQHNYVNMSYIRTTIDMPMWIGEWPQGHNPTKTSMGNQGTLKVGEIAFPKEEHTN